MRRAILTIICGIGLGVPVLASAQQATPAAGTPTAGQACLVGRQADGSVLLPTDQVITPAGAQIEFLGRPTVGALRPDGKSAAFLTGFNKQGTVTVVDLAAGKATQTFGPQSDPKAKTQPVGSFAGLVYAQDGSKLYASDANGAIIIANVAADGTLALDSWVQLPKRGEQQDISSRPGGMALSADGKTLYVALNMNNTLGVFDLAAKALTAEIPVGNAPHSVVLVGTNAYVSDEGGRPATPEEFTNDSAGTKIVADLQTGGATTGEVSVVDLAKRAVTKTIAVGLHPTGLALAGSDLFAANTNSDTVSVIDTATNEVVKTFAVQAFNNAPYGSAPTAVAVVGNQLVVSLARNNAFALYSWGGPSAPVSFEGLVPTGWNPSHIIAPADGKTLIVVNTKGVGSLGPEQSIGPEAKNPTGKWVHSNEGSISLVPFPTKDQLAADTAAVNRNNRWTGSGCAAPPASAGAAKAIPARLGDPSLIKHVVYIVKENRTYDQVLGDDSRGNGDPSLTQFGATVTPNEHALAKQFPLLDNLYCSGSLSADGHQWSTQAYVPQYLEQAFGDFGRSYPYNGGDALTYGPTGFLWENATKHGQSVRVYGEYANEERGPVAKAGKWADWYHDWQIAAGKATGTPHVQRGEFTAHSDVPSLDALLFRDFPAYVGQLIPDQTRADLFLEEFNKYESAGNLPNLLMVQLVQDHTTGVTPDFPTPRAMVADNDLALGRIVDAISHSKDWATTAIFVIEDDAQNGVDHVDGHRTTGFVISPYAKHGVVDHTYYTQIDMVRTIEQILGLPPMNQMDMAAAPMWNAFTDTPDPAPFTAVANQVPLDEMNPPKSALGGVRLAWAEASSKMGFGGLGTAPDAQDENLLNRAIWYAAHDFAVPYPGDARVLWPSEVPPSRAPAPADASGRDTSGRGN